MKHNERWLGSRELEMIKILLEKEVATHTELSNMFQGRSNEIMKVIRSLKMKGIIIKRKAIRHYHYHTKHMGSRKASVTYVYWL